MTGIEIFSSDDLRDFRVTVTSVRPLHLIRARLDNPPVIWREANLVVGVLKNAEIFVMIERCHLKARLPLAACGTCGASDGVAS